jgi:hypothetical protein
LDPGIPKYESGESNHSTVVAQRVDGRIILKKTIHKIGWEGVNRVYLAQDTDHVNTEMNIATNFLSR